MAYIRDQLELIVVDTKTTNQTRVRLPDVSGPYADRKLAWSDQESKFYIRDFDSKRTHAITLSTNLEILSQIEMNKNLPLFPAYGRIVARGRYSNDTCGNLVASSIRGLGSHLRIGPKGEAAVLQLQVHRGLLGLSGFYFNEIAFVNDCENLVFESQDHIYLLDLSKRRIGTIAFGERFILLNDRYKARITE